MYHAIKYLFPTAVSDEDFMLIDDGDGVRIINWNAAKLGSQPSQAEIDAAMPLARARLVASAVRDQVAHRLAPSDFRFIGDYPVFATFTQADKTALAARRQTVRDFGNAIDPAAIASVAEIAALPWPVV